AYLTQNQHLADSLLWVSPFDEKSACQGAQVVSACGCATCENAAVVTTAIAASYAIHEPTTPYPRRIFNLNIRRGYGVVRGGWGRFRPRHGIEAAAGAHFVRNRLTCIRAQGRRR